MELPQPRQFGAGGRKTTHDFLSLYSPVQQDPIPSQGSYLETHDFLQPLEGVGKKGIKEDKNIEVSTVEKPPPPAPPPSVTHTLPGGIGTYSVSYSEQRAPKPEVGLFAAAPASSAERNDENSNCSSYTGSGFSLWEESTVKKGKTGKENISGEIHIQGEANPGGGQWTTSVDRPSQSSSSHKLHSAALSSLSSSQPPSNQKYQSFMNMITSSKLAQEEEEDEEDEEFNIKKEASSHPKGNLAVRVDGKSTDQKPSTPRSKHSATEQRRRSKINDRFQRLREIIPHGDQKRDKASFLLEVIEYIQYLEEKVHRYEAPNQGWNHEPSKLMPWGNCYRTANEGFPDQSQCTNSGSGQALKFAARMDDSKAGISPANPINGQKLADSISTIAAFRERCQQPEVTNKASSYPPLLQQLVFPFGGISNATAPISPAVALDMNSTASHLQSHFQPRACPTDTVVASSDHKLKEQEQTIESGTISISSDYSQGLLNSLTKALQNSGVDLSQANISVQIDLGKRMKSRLYSSISAPQDAGVPMSNQSALRPQISGRGEESDQALKRLKKGRG